MEQIIYHPHVHDVLSNYHDRVRASLLECVLSHKANRALPVEILREVILNVAPDAFLFTIPLFRTAVLLACYVEYAGYSTVFMVIQRAKRGGALTVTEIALAQNALYECQLTIDQTMPRIS